MNINAYGELPTLNLELYNNSNNGGISKCINGCEKSTGQPNHKLNVLANCVGWAWGRINELNNYYNNKQGFNLYVNGNGGNIYGNWSGDELIKSQTPKPPCLWVMQTKEPEGHVALIEKYENGIYYISESAYNSVTYRTRELTELQHPWATENVGFLNLTIDQQKIDFKKLKKEKSFIRKYLIFLRNKRRV